MLGVCLQLYLRQTGSNLGPRSLEFLDHTHASCIRVRVRALYISLTTGRQAKHVRSCPPPPSPSVQKHLW